MPSGLSDVARALIVFGVLVVGAGLALLLLPKMPWLGRLPGDILIQRERVTVYLPLATSIVVSLLLSLLWWGLGRSR